jgi:membrane associated rhomboid family serine protease
MGIYDREYYRDEPRRPGISSWSAVTTLIVINVAVFVADMLSPAQFVNVIDRRNFVVEQVETGRWIDSHLGLRADLFNHPWNAWQLVTYGFIHDPNSIMHILFNMFGLWLFGRDVEGLYGKREFYRIYLSLVVLSGLAWVALNKLLGDNASGVIGASGAVMGVMAIYILHFPNRVFLFYGIIPMPAWVLGIAYVAFDILGATGSFRLGKENVANTAHLAGAAFGVLYCQTRWTLFSLWPSRLFSGMFRRPKYRVHRGDDDGDTRGGGSAGEQRQLQQQVDDILAKISREGESSLTAAERRTLEEASRRYRGREPGARG